MIDTNVLSEVVRIEPEPKVREWLASLPATQAFLSVLTVGEIARGVALLPAGKRKEQLRRWLEHDLPQRFAGRLLAVDRKTAEAWGELSARAQSEGRPLPVVDGLLLATARAHGLTLATRNARDCEGRGVSVFDPWNGAEPRG